MADATDVKTRKQRPARRRIGRSVPFDIADPLDRFPASFAALPKCRPVPIEDRPGPATQAGLKPAWRLRQVRGGPHNRWVARRQRRLHAPARRPNKACRETCLLIICNELP
ncbi:hypothetical protein SAHY_02547 [Salinisphaera hydrothermalis EPR70]